MNTRAKFVVNSISTEWAQNIWDYKNNGTTSKPVHSIKLIPVYGNSGENKEFFASTPSGQIELRIVNEDAAKIFELNKEYYVDFTPAN